MKKNLYYHTVFRRGNFLKTFFFGFFLGIASWPRLLIEVFLRKNMGERYFSLATAIWLAILLFFFPFLVAKAGSFSAYGYHESESFIKTFFKNITWYIYLGLFLFFAFKRQKEVDREPSVFDFARFSLSTGKINPFFYELNIFGKPADPRRISTIIEPGIFFIIGIVLTVMMQKVGILILVCSICYSFSYYGAYHLGDEFIMDTIDEMICNEEMVDSFVKDKKPEDTRGFYAYGQRPNNPDMRRKVVDNIIDEEDVADAI